MCRNCNTIMKAISELKDEGVLSNKKVKVLRRGVPQIAEFADLTDIGVDEIKSPILAISRFVEKQRIMQVKPNRVAGKKRPIRKISYIPQCLKYPESKPFCV